MKKWKNINGKIEKKLKNNKAIGNVKIYKQNKMLSQYIYIKDE